VKKFSFLLVTALMVLGAFTYAIAADHLLITEFCVSPTNAEFVEIYNPTGTTIDLSNYYLTDATHGDNYYYNIVLQNGTAGAAGPGNYYDFNAKFPEEDTIVPGEYQTIAFRDTSFSSTYGLDANYELFSTDPSVPDMIPAEDGSIDDNAGLTNGGEVLILYYWDGQSDLVEDVDYVLWGDKDEAVDKTGVSIDGPDPGTATSSYLDDTPIANQAVVGGGSDPHDYGESAQRSGITECGETLTGGNGITGNDETSEDMTVSGGCWTIFATPTPGEPPSAVPLVQGSLPLAFSLSQNYPNPFNPTTQINFSLPTKGQVRLSIYNIVGQKVAELENAELNAGNYRVSWEAKGFASGIYFCRLKTGANEKVIKIMLLK